MSDLNICRVCLIYNVRGYDLANNLLESYEQLLGCKLKPKDNLPIWLCYECAILLIKYEKFRQKCVKGKFLLEQIIQRGKITYKTIKKINRIAENLHSNLQIAGNTKYIKSYSFRHRTKHRRNAKKLENNHFNFEFIEEYVNPGITEIKSENVGSPNDDNINDIDFENDNNLNNDNDIPVKNSDVNIFDKSINTEVKNGTSIEPNNDISININHKNDTSDSDDDVPLCNQSMLLKKSRTNNIIKTNKNDTNDVKAKKQINKANQKTSGKIKKYAKQKKEFLTPKYWDQVKLPEDDAMAEFRKKETDSKYINAEYKCDKCFKTFSSFEIMERHMKLRHDEKKCSFECRFCHMRFRVKCKLAYHMTEHYTVYNCLRCERKFTVFSSAMYHEQYHNGVIKKCEDCGKEFTHNSSYYTHIRMKHRSAHVCTLCGASFVSEAGLAQHKRITHIVNNTVMGGETRDNYCVKCDAAFASAAAYDEHLANSKLHVDAAADPSNFKDKQKKAPKKRDNIICSYCGSWFLAASACYKHHAARHPLAPPPTLAPRHVCELCGVSIALASLKSHMNLHSGNSKHCCVTCGVQFTTKGAHDRHQVTHTGEKPYACNLCEKRFTQRGGVLLHYRTFHLKQPYPQRNRKKKTNDQIPFPTT